MAREQYHIVTSTHDRLYFDIETRSPVDIKNCGSHTYARNQHTDVIVACWAIGDGPVNRWWPGQPVPDAVRAHKGWVVAHNAAFERAVVRHILAPRYGWPAWEVTHYDCTMGRAAMFNIAKGLDDAAATLTGGQWRKDHRGDALIKQLCVPTGWANGGYAYDTDPAAIEEMAQYCERDVTVTREVDKRLPLLSMHERQVAIVSDIINDRGVQVDFGVLPHFVALRDQAIKQIDARIKELTGGFVERHTQNKRLGQWLETPNGSCSADVIREQVEVVKQLIADAEHMLAQGFTRYNIGNAWVPREDYLGYSQKLHEKLEVLELRSMVKSSLGKLDAFLKRTDSDGRLRGSYVFGGAGQTGRWSSSGVQLQNVPRDGAPSMTDPVTGKRKKWGPGQIIEALLAADPANPPKDIGGKPLPHIMAGGLRALLIAKPGHVLVQQDLSNIEGRVAALVARDDAKLDRFRQADRGDGPDLYRITAGAILGKQPEDVTDDERQGYGKVPELACQYGGGHGAFGSMAKVYGVKMSSEQVARVIEGWRNNNQPTVLTWARVEHDLRSAAEKLGGGLGGPGVPLYALELMSGRPLYYHNLRLSWQSRELPSGETKRSVGLVCSDHRYGAKKLYGGLLFENVVQALSRDILAHHMVEIERAGLPIVHHAHDEIVVEVPEAIGDQALAYMGQVMKVPPSWCPNLPLASAGWVGTRYRK